MSMQKMTSQIDSILESVGQISDLNHDGHHLAASDRDAIDRQLVRITMSAQAMKKAIIGTTAGIMKREVAA